jgi:pSer/pThr/pTyr-binding forkhead associated (FHA) protein
MPRQQPVSSPPPPQAGNAAARRPQPPTPGYQVNNNVRPNGGHAGGAPANSMPQMGSAGPTLFLVYNGQRYPVTKDQFIIGRGSKTSDLPIKDGNISRKHAAVIRRNGTFYIKDLGSTNGIDYKGMRIDNKRIDEGDVFHLCDYELRFTYRAD